MNYRSLPTDLIGVHWVEAWGKRGVITGCFGLPPREVMLKELESMGAVTDLNAPPPLPARPWWQSWGVIGVLALTVGLLLWQPAMKRNPRRRLMRRNPKLVNNRRHRTSRRLLRNSWNKLDRERRQAQKTCKHDYVFKEYSHPGSGQKQYLVWRCSKCGKIKRQTQAQQYALAKGRLRKSKLRSNVSDRRKRENACGRSVEGHDYQYGGQYGKNNRIVLTFICSKCGKTRKRYNDSRSWLQENAKGSNREVRDIIRIAEQAGWKVEWTKKGHIQFKSPYPNTPIVVVAGTPSDHRAMKNVKSMLRRAGLQLEENTRTKLVSCKNCGGTGDDPKTWPIEACAACEGTGKRPETDEERRKREARNARSRARSGAMRSVGMRKSRYGGWE